MAAAKKIMPYDDQTCQELGCLSQHSTYTSMGPQSITCLALLADEYTTCRYEKEFDQVQDVFELQRNLNNAFAYDLVPSPSVITAALRAARRVNDYPTAVRIFEGM